MLIFYREANFDAFTADNDLMEKLLENSLKKPIVNKFGRYIKKLVVSETNNSRSAALKLMKLL